MSNRNILNQNIIGRNILNIKNKNLLDGNAIKISDRNNINVDMKTNTTEQTIINDTDLFLLSDTTGETIKYITGSNLISEVSGDILAGSNLTKVGSTINLDTGLTSMVSIDGGTNDLKLQRSGNDKITLETTNVKFNTNTSTLGAALRLTMGSGGQTNNADYELKQEYLASGFRSGKYDTGVRFQRFLASSDFTQLFCGYQEDEGQCVILNPNDDLHYVFKAGGGPYSGTLKISKPDQSVHNFNMDLGNASSTFTMSSLTNAIFDCDTFTCASSRLVVKKSNDILYLFNNATLPVAIGNNNEFLQQNGDGSLLQLRANVVKILAGTTELIKIDNTDGVNIYKNSFLNSNKIYFDNTTNHYISIGPSDMDGVEIEGFGISTDKACFRVKAGGYLQIALLEAYTDRVEINKKLRMNNQLISFQANNDSHYAKYSNTNMNGVEIAGFGSTEAGSPLFRVTSSSGTNPIVFEIERAKALFYKNVEFNQPIFMENNQINFQTDTTNHYIKYSATTNPTTDGIEIVGHSNVRLSNSSQTTTQLQTNATDPITSETEGSTYIFHKCAVIKGDVDLQNDPNDLFTLRNSGFVKSLLQSDSGDCELAFKTGSGGDSTNQAMLKYFTNKFFQIRTPDDSEFSVNIGSQKVIYFKKESTNFSTVISSGDGANGNNIVYIMADTDNTIESANPSLEFHQDRSLVTFKIGIRQAQNRSYINAALSSDLSIQKDGTDRILVNGSGVTVYGTFTDNSDDRIKFGETTLTNALTTIKKLNPVSYRQTDGLDMPDSPDLPIHWGFVAQELYNKVPEMRFAVAFNKTMKRNFVDGDLDGDCVEDIYDQFTTSQGEVQEYPEICSVAYNTFAALNVKAIQELLIRVETLEQQLVTQSNLISNLQSQINNNI